MEVLKIVEDYLTRTGAQGLCNPEAECGCTLDDLAPCGQIGGDCQAAEKVDLCKLDDCECGYCAAGGWLDFMMVAIGDPGESPPPGEPPADTRGTPLLHAPKGAA